MELSSELPNTRDNIQILGARVHNLKNINVNIPKNKLVVITGLSGSGKSSLAFDTLYAEGQRRYVESLSAYARQFLGRLNKPDCDAIIGLTPAIAIEQKVTSKNPRSTVGTATEVYDFLKLLYARLGKTISPISGDEVKKHSVTDVLNFISSLNKGERIMILAPLQKDTSWKSKFDLLLSQGFARILHKNEVKSLGEMVSNEDNQQLDVVDLVVDRAIADLNDEENKNRLADSIQTAFFEGHGICEVLQVDSKKRQIFSDKFEADGIRFEVPSTHLFSFNTPLGACKKCEGFGSIIGIDETLVIPDGSKSVFQDCVVAWKGDKMQEWKDDFIIKAAAYNFPIHRAYNELNDEQRKLLWKGKGNLKGIDAFFEFVEQNSYKIQYRVMLARYRGKTNCNVCEGSRLSKSASHVFVSGKSIAELVNTPLNQLLEFFIRLKFESYEEAIAKRILEEIRIRLSYLCDVGLGYLTLNRNTSTLSGGESQRIHLATSLGSSLVGSTYILDEPSIGLHPRDTEKLIGVLKKLRDLGNTVVVVEHDEEIMHAADLIIDIGPESGYNGGELVFQGAFNDLKYAQNSYTADYLLGKLKPYIPKTPLKPFGFLELNGARENNLKGINVKFPLGVLCAVTGVSGSGKSTLVKQVFYPALVRKLGGQSERPGRFQSLEGNLSLIQSVEMVDQNPIGRSSRSNPVTYIKAFDDIRMLFASQTLAKQRGYQARHFSFNVSGGRCEACEGEGQVTIEMQFMADVHVECEVCKGKKFKDEILEIRVFEKNIFDILNFTVVEAISFFTEANQLKISEHLSTLNEVGLGYVKLGQSSSTLSGGEAQRIKLASFLLKGKDAGNTLFIFDEPTTGLHFHDVEKLLKSFRALLKKGHSIVVIEHHSQVIKAADWVIELGPDGGDLGGNLIFAGDRETFKSAHDQTLTAQWIFNSNSNGKSLKNHI